ncbi:MAG: phenylacetate-CoA oxygenase subunit PaaC [Alicyclobacillus sp.]|nr:phenylacetate-CoA oxygenase subunit PaaC [Alicyclobacillus sp.]
MADDDLVLGHRHSEWLGVAPDIEEDVAFSSIAQDEVGHAALYYELASQLGAGDADRLAFDRPVGERRSAAFVELENGDWARTAMRHFLYDAFEEVRLDACTRSGWQPLQRAATKVRREEFYHRLHSRTQLHHLAKAGGEAFARLEHALADLWPYVASLFDLGPHAAELRATGVLPADAAALRSAWEAVVVPELSELGFGVPACGGTDATSAAHRGAHHPALAELLTTMRAVLDVDAAAASW